MHFHKNLYDDREHINVKCNVYDKTVESLDEPFVSGIQPVSSFSFLKRGRSGYEIKSQNFFFVFSIVHFVNFILTRIIRKSVLEQMVGTIENIKKLFELSSKWFLNESWI